MDNAMSETIDLATLAVELQAVSVLIVFVAVAINLVMRPAWDELDTNNENYDQRNPQVSRTSYRMCDGCRCFSWPLASFSTLVAWLLTPGAVTILLTSDFRWWHFDLLAGC